MRRSAWVFCFVLFILGAAVRSGSAQAVESADARQLQITAGGMVSGFQPDEGETDLIGLGTYVDVHFTHWFQVEGEARWLRWNQYYGEHQDNYLIGPRVPIRRLGSRGQIYGKVLIGYGKMTFPFGYGYGTFTDLAYGAAVDYRWTRKLTLKTDFEFQEWPKWLNNQQLYPYGVSVGVGYKVF
jgi:hypothetical protein